MDNLWSMLLYIITDQAGGGGGAQSRADSLLRLAAATMCDRDSVPVALPAATAATRLSEEGRASQTRLCKFILYAIIYNYNSQAIIRPSPHRRRSGGGVHSL